MKNTLFVLAMITSITTTAQQPGQYAQVNGLKLYYEVHGSGEPLVLLHGGGSTINTTYGRVLPLLAQQYKVIAIELQAHGRTADINRPLSFEQDADDVADLLQQLKIFSAHFMGFSNGATTCLQIAIRHVKLVNKLVLASGVYKRDGMMTGFFEGMKGVTIDHMPAPLKEAFLQVNPDPKALQAMFDRDKTRMLGFSDIPEAAIEGIQSPVLVINADADVVRTEHALELSRQLPHAKLAILPGGHGEYLGEICAVNKESKLPALTIGLIDEFLKKK